MHLYDLHILNSRMTVCFQINIPKNPGIDLSAEKARLEKEIAAAQKELAGCEKTLANEGFVAKAAPAVVQKKRDRAAELKEILAALTAQVADFS